MYNRNPKHGTNDPKIGKIDEGRLTNLSKIMLQQTLEDMKIGKRSPLDPYKGPVVSAYLKDKNHMPICTNDAHSTTTNNGYTRKPSGGFFYH